MLRQLVILLSYVNIGSLLIPIGIGLVRRQKLSPGLWAGWGAIVVYFVLFVISLAILQLKSGTNTLLINYLISALFALGFAVAFYLALPPGSRRVVVLVLAAAGLTGIVLEAFVGNRYSEISQWSVPLQTILTTITVLVYLQYLIHETRVSLLTLPFFWLSIGLLISSVLGTMYDLLQQPLMASSREWLLIFICFQLGITIFCNLLYGVGFYRTK